MSNYSLRPGEELHFSVDGAAWENVTFDAKDFRDIGDTTAEELVAVLNHSGSLAAYVDDGGELVIASSSRGGGSSLEIDVRKSSASAALGLRGDRLEAHGSGLLQPWLRGTATEPYQLGAGAEMTILIDRRSRRVTFEKLDSDNASAAEVVTTINARVPKLAHVTRDGGVLLASPNIGPDTFLRVMPADNGKPDAAAALGFVGAAASSKPHHADPARLVARSGRPQIVVTNLTWQSVEIDSGSQPLRLPPRGSAPVTNQQVAAGSLQRLIRAGAVTLWQATEK